MRNFYGNLERWKAMPLALALLLLSPQQEAQAVCNEKTVSRLHNRLRYRLSELSKSIRLR